MKIADLAQIEGRRYPAGRRTQNIVGGASPISADNFCLGLGGTSGKAYGLFAGIAANATAITTYELIHNLLGVSDTGNLNVTRIHAQTTTQNNALAPFSMADLGREIDRFLRDPDTLAGPDAAMTVPGFDRAPVSV